MEQEHKTKIQIWSKFKGCKERLYGEYENQREASKVITNFIFGTNRNHTYKVKIIEV